MPGSISNRYGGGAWQRCNFFSVKQNLFDFDVQNFPKLVHIENQDQSTNIQYDTHGQEILNPVRYYGRNYRRHESFGVRREYRQKRKHAKCSQKLNKKRYKRQQREYKSQFKLNDDIILITFTWSPRRPTYIVKSDQTTQTDPYEPVEVGSVGSKVTQSSVLSEKLEQDVQNDPVDCTSETKFILTTVVPKFGSTEPSLLDKINKLDGSHYEISKFAIDLLQKENQISLIFDDLREIYLSKNDFSLNLNIIKVVGSIWCRCTQETTQNLAKAFLLQVCDFTMQMSLNEQQKGEIFGVTNDFSNFLGNEFQRFSSDYVDKVQNDGFISTGSHNYDAVGGYDQITLQQGVTQGLKDGNSGHELNFGDDVQQKLSGDNVDQKLDEQNNVLGGEFLGFVKCNPYGTCDNQLFCIIRALTQIVHVILYLQGQGGRLDMDD